MEYGIPVPMKSSRYKFAVLVYDKYEKRDKVVKFGHRDYEDFTQHHDHDRRARYLKRSAGIRDGRGNLTKDNPLSANYWSRRYLWASGERYKKVSP